MKGCEDPFISVWQVSKIAKLTSVTFGTQAMFLLNYFPFKWKEKIQNVGTGCYFMQPSVNSTRKSDTSGSKEGIKRALPKELLSVCG